MPQIKLFLDHRVLLPFNLLPLVLSCDLKEKKSEKAASLVDQMVKNLPAMQETPVQSSDPLL